MHLPVELWRWSHEIVVGLCCNLTETLVHFLSVSRLFFLKKILNVCSLPKPEKQLHVILLIWP